MNPVFSIITVVFNDVKHIEETIRSVLNQSFYDFEYIIIDGGSKDGTISIIKKYEKYLTVFLTEQDNGIYDAMNKGVCYSKAQWVCFMNSGDVFYNNDVLKIVASNISANNDVLYADTNTILEFGEYIIKSKDVEYLKQGMPFCHQSSFVKRELLSKYPFDLTYKYVADYNLFYMLYHKNYNFSKLNMVIATFDAKDGVSSTHKREVFNEILRVQSNHFSIKYYIIVKYRMYKYFFAEFINRIFPALIKSWRKFRVS